MTDHHELTDHELDRKYLPAGPHRMSTPECTCGCDAEARAAAVAPAVAVIRKLLRP